MNNFFPRPSQSTARSTQRLVLSASLLLLLVVSACDTPSAPPSQTSQVTTEEFTSTPEQCERDIDNLLDALQPDRYGISSDQKITVNMLNTWLTQCGEAEDFSTDDNDAELRAGLLPEMIEAQTSLNRFTDVDAEYLRNSLLIQQLVETTLTNAERTDVDRAVALFYKVVRTVELGRETPGMVALEPLQSLLYGRGLAETRAWIYGMMLRQLRLDVVIIRPRSNGGRSDRSLLIGVVIPDDGVYLFDFNLGVPLASPFDEADSPLPQVPATLAAAREHDAIFRQHDLRGLSYPVTSEQLSDIDVLAIGTSSTWAPRFGKLQSALPIRLEVYDGLTANSLQEQGLIDRLIAAGQEGVWDAKDIGIWEFPDRTLLGLMTLPPEQQEMLTRLSFVLQGPINVSVDPKTGRFDVLTPPERNLFQARIAYIQGDIGSALQVYLRSRLSLPHPRTRNKDTSDWSTYWAALAQYELADYAVASESAEHYLKRPGAWRTAAKALQANALAQEGKFAEAAQILEREPVRAPQHLGNQSLVRRWRRLAKGESAIDPQLTIPAAESQTPATDLESPADEPEPAEDSPPMEEPPDPNLPMETPSDLPPSDERPDPRFEEDPDANLPPADEPPASSEEQDAGDEPTAESDTTDPPSDEEAAENE